jgi:hypothetical protein
MKINRTLEFSNEWKNAVKKGLIKGMVQLTG